MFCCCCAFHVVFENSDVSQSLVFVNYRLAGGFKNFFKSLSLIVLLWSSKSVTPITFPGYPWALSMCTYRSSLFLESHLPHSHSDDLSNLYLDSVFLALTAEFPLVGVRLSVLLNPPIP